MLKRRIGSIVLSAAMLAGTIAVPVSAKHVVREDVPTTLTLINETFDDYTVSETPQSVSNGGSVGSATFTQNENIVLKTGGWGSQKFSIVNDSNTDNYMSVTNEGDAFVQFKNPNGSTSIAEGDIIKINFDMKFDSDLSKNEKATDFKLLLNDNLSTYYKFISTSKKDEAWLKSGDSSGTLLAMKHNNGDFASANDVAYGPKVVGDTWINYSIVLDTKDEDNDGKQTLRVTAKYNNGTTDVEDYVFGYFDADNSNNSNAKTYDLVKEFSSLTMSIGNWKGSEEVHYQPNTRVNNFKAELVTTRNKVTDVKSSIGEVTLIDEKFNSYDRTESSISVGGNQSKPFSQNDKIVLKSDYEYSTGKYDIVACDESDTDNALEFSGGLVSAQLKNTLGESTEITSGDVLTVSFDFKGNDITWRDDKGHKDYAAFVKVNGTKNVKWGYVSGDDSKSWVNTTKDNDKGSIINMRPFKHDASGDLSIWAPSNDLGWGVLTMRESDWVSFKAVINTKDPNRSDKQTLKVTATYFDPAENKTVTKQCYGEYDADTSVEGNTIIDSFDKLIVGIEDWDNEAKVQLDNVKVTVTHQGLEAWGAATTKDNIEGALDDDKFLADSTLEARAYVNPTETNTMLIAAVYDENDVLIDCKTAKQDENFNGLLTAEVSTEGAKKVKMFAVDSITLAPKLVSKTLTVDESAINANSAH